MFKVFLLDPVSKSDDNIKKVDGSKNKNSLLANDSTSYGFLQKLEAVATKEQPSSNSI